MTQASTILIVDDEPAGRETLAALLHSQGYRLAFATNGSEALAQARASVPDLILLDVMMPELDGFAVCRQLRDDPSLAEVPIILVTALDDRDSRLAGIEAGADDFVSKPFDRAELRARVRTITRLNRYRRLLTERATFEWVVDKATDGYVIVDADGLMRYANTSAKLFLGMPADAPLGESAFTDIAARHYQVDPQTSWAQWLADAQASTPTPRLLVRPASATAEMSVLQIETLELADGQGRRHLLRMRDITAALNDQQSIWTFQALVRHKLGTALSQLNGAMRLLEHLRLVSTETVSKELVEVAFNGANRLQSDITDIFQFIDAEEVVRPEGGTCNLSDLGTLLAENTERLGISTPDLRFHEIDEPEALTLAISRPALMLILGELLQNAWKFHPKRAPKVEVRATRANDSIQIEILDDGRTLAPEQLVRVWQPYFQGERYFTGQVPGMGLGLPMVAMLMGRIGGTCRIYNREPAPGVGIVLSIPLAR